MSIPVYKNERKNPMSGMTSGPEPRWTYGRPTEKPQFGKPPDLGTDINSYSLPAIDTQTERRNFPGYGEAQYLTMADLQDKTQDSSGTTETDSETAPSDGGYTKLNTRLAGKQKSRWNTKRS